MISYYDLILGLIPAVLIGFTGLLSVIGFAVTVALPIASAIAVGLVGHAIFINGPTSKSSNPNSGEVTDRQAEIQ